MLLAKYVLWKKNEQRKKNEKKRSNEKKMEKKINVASICGTSHKPG